jgi:hypothetical protein
MSTFGGHRGSPVGRRSFLVVLALLLLALSIPALALAKPASQSVAASPGELGDAPDRTNHFGVGMTAYPLVPANFPTVYDPALGAPQGPLHLNPVPNGWLGANLSREQDADLMPDADGITNIDPPTNTPNRDRFDDGVIPVNPNNIFLPQCANTQFRYIVTGAAAVPVPNARVNVWIDFNGDGDWADRFTCTAGGVVIGVPEWAVRNQPVNIVPGSVVWATPVFPSFHPAGHKDAWMRINIAEINAPANPITLIIDGTGPGPGYKYGETEDYLLRWVGGSIYQPF